MKGACTSADARRKVLRFLVRRVPDGHFVIGDYVFSEAHLGDASGASEARCRGATWVSPVLRAGVQLWPPMYRTGALVVRWLGSTALFVLVVAVLGLTDCVSD